MNVTSSGPHILLFERDQQLVTLLAGELALAGYEVHTARTAVEIFDAIARFSVKLVMVDLAQAQASRREFWVALDAQRRGRGVQVFTFRCTNLAGYGPDDPDERVDTVLTDLEVDGMRGIAQLVEAVRARVPGTTPAAPAYAAPHMPATPSAAHVQPLQRTVRQQQPSQEIQMPPPARPAEAPRPAPSTFTDKIRAVIYPGGRNGVSVPETTWSSSNPSVQSQHASPYQQPDVQPRPQASQRFAEAEPSPSMYREDMFYQASVNPPQAEKRNPPVSAQAYPASTRPETRSADEESGLDQLSRMLRGNQSASHNTIVNGHMQNSVTYAAPGLDIDQQELQTIRAQILQAAQLDEAYERSNMPQPRSVDPNGLGTQLRASPIQDMPFEREAEYRRPTNGSLAQSQENYARPAMTVLQPTQVMPPVQPMPAYQPPMSQGTPAQASPIQRSYQPQPMQPQTYQTSPAQTYQPQPIQASPAQTYQPQSMQASPAQTYQPQPVQASPAQSYQPQSSFIPATDNRSFATSISSQMRPVAPTHDMLPETPISALSNSQIRASHPEMSANIVEQQRQTTSPLSIDRDSSLSEQLQVSLQQNLARRPEVTTSDDMLLDIVKSLPPMAPAPPIPPPLLVLSGRATRSLGSVLLEGHLVPEERLQVAQHVQRMMRGVDLNYQLGEILLMFKLLTPDQLLAASLVSYGMISTIQISALGRIRQELHAIGLEYDLESLVILFRILTPEQLREVRASWSS
ncbi:MAG: hypothetical protein ABI234_17540 [Ktedonobacteraceae bacterium]